MISSNSIVKVSKTKIWEITKSARLKNYVFLPTTYSFQTCLCKKTKPITAVNDAATSAQKH